MVAPLRKHLTFTFGSIDSGDFRNVGHAEHPQLANLSYPCILIGKPAANELIVFSGRRVLKNRYSLCDAALHEVRGFKRPSAIGIDRQDNEVGGSDRFVFDDERPSRGSQNRFPKGANKDDRKCS